MRMGEGNKVKQTMKMKVRGTPVTGRPIMRGGGQHEACHEVQQQI